MNTPIDYSSLGQNTTAPDYSKSTNWLSLPASTPQDTPEISVAAESPASDLRGLASPKDAQAVLDLTGSPAADLFFCYPTAWRAAPGADPICSVNNRAMRRGAHYYLKTRASAFDGVGRVFSPYYRQLDASFVVSQPLPEEQLALFEGIPATDVQAAFSYYIEHYNGGRPYVLVGHSQGSAVLLVLLTRYLRNHPAVYDQMIAAYLIGLPITRAFYADNPHLRPARSAHDLGVIISYNTQAPQLDGPNPLANPDSVLINPVSWRTDNSFAPASQSKGSVLVDAHTGTMKDLGAIADARIDPSQGVVICDVNRETFSSAPASRAYFPLGVLHENDIPLYYYDLRANAKLRLDTWLNRPSS
ncbi:MAG: DUF3089 domain-containing protein [Coriobacteriales bacterium]|nr:DUF3089 domain-containing protein [Coriobacteriales bacterium]